MAVKTEQEIKAEFAAICQQLDGLADARGTEAWKTLSQRCISLGWMLGHPKAPERLVFSPEILNLLSSLY